MHRSVRLSAIAAAVLVLAGCGGGNGSDEGTARPDLQGLDITVGSAGEDRSVVLAEIYGQALEAKGATVVQAHDVGSPSEYLPKLERGEVTVIPELSDALLAYLVAPVPPVAKNVSEQVDAIEAALPAGLTILTPAAAEDKEAIVCRRDIVDEYGLATLSKLGDVSGEIVLGGPADFRTGSPFGLVGFKERLGADFRAFEPLPDVATVIDALESGAIDCGALRSTTFSGRGSSFATLDDDAAIVPNEAVVPLIVKDSASPEVQAVLDAVSSTLDTAGLAALMAQVRDEGVDPAQAASAWLEANDLS